MNIVLRDISLQDVNTTVLSVETAVQGQVDIHHGNAIAVQHSSMTVSSLDTEVQNQRETIHARDLTAPSDVSATGSSLKAGIWHQQGSIHNSDATVEFRINKGPVMAVMCQLYLTPLPLHHHRKLVFNINMQQFTIVI